MNALTFDQLGVEELTNQEMTQIHGGTGSVTSLVGGLLGLGAVGNSVNVSPHTNVSPSVNILNGNSILSPDFSQTNGCGCGC